MPLQQDAKTCRIACSCGRDELRVSQRTVRLHGVILRAGNAPDKTSNFRDPIRILLAGRSSVEAAANRRRRI
jgi:hypothetical protein